MKILVAEDDPLTLEAIDACLTSEGFETILAKNGAIALDLWKQNQVDLICLDIMMPEIDGFELCRKIRREDEEIPVIFLSAKNEEIDVVVGLELGADDFVRKPFGKPELLARIRSALRRSSSKKQRQVSSFAIREELQIYPTQLRAERLPAGEEIQLSPRDVSILQLLTNHLDEAVSRDTLLNECWGIDFFPESRSLDQYIAQLRKKIEPIPGTPTIIETVRGIGYRISANAS